MDYETISLALKNGGSVRAAAKLLGKSYSSLIWWLLKNGYEVKKQAILVKSSQSKGE